MEVNSLKKKLQDKGVKYALAQFVDIHGVAKTKAVPISHFEDIFNDGAGFAAFAVAGLGLPPNGPDFMAIGNVKTVKEMMWMPEFVRVVCNGHVNGKPHDFDTRVICERILNQLRHKYGCEFYSGLEPEFFLLKQPKVGCNLEIALESDTLSKPCYDYRIFNRAAPVITEISDSLMGAGIDVYQIDHEDANGQFEINFKYSDALTSADNFIFFKMAASEIAHKHGMICSFMPKPFKNRPGSGMHMHMSMGKDGKNLFEDKNDKNGLGLSEIAYQFLAGILYHAKALTAIGCPSVNSYKRLVGTGSVSGATWSPTSITYGDNNRTAMVRIPYGRLELRCPDSSANPYLLTAAVIAAGMDGIEKKMNPGKPLNRNIYEITAEERRALEIESLPSNLIEALSHLQENQILKDALGESFVTEFIKIKREEWAEYHSEVSQWERDRYAEFF